MYFSKIFWNNSEYKIIKVEEKIFIPFVKLSHSHKNEKSKNYTDFKNFE